MNSRENVLRAIEFRDPERIPLCLEFAGDPLNQAVARQILLHFTSDFCSAGNGDPNFRPKKPGEQEWGYCYESFGETMGEVKNPALANWDDFPSWRAQAPDFSMPCRYERAKVTRQKHPEKFSMGGMGLLMEELINLRGYNEYMMDFYLEPENLIELIDLIYHEAGHAIDGYAEAGMDAVIAWEDWGLQDRLMIHPDMWRSFFKPRMRDMVDHIHQMGMKYVLHSCGYIVDILDDLVDMGVDVIQMDQQLNMGFDCLKRWQGQICFFCPVDIQYSPLYTPQQLTEHVQAMYRALDNGHGGLMYKLYGQPAAIHMPSEQIKREIEAFQALCGNI